MAEYTFSITDTIRYSFSVFKRYPDIMLTAMILVVASQMLSIVTEAFFTDNGAVHWLLQVMGSIGTIFVTLGVTKVVLMVYDEEDIPGFSVIFGQLPSLLPGIGISLVSIVIIMFGLLFLIIPGIWFSIALSFATYYLVDRDGGVFDSLRMSWNITKGHIVQIFLFTLAIVGLNILGFLALGVGLLVTVPVSMIAYGSVYRQLLDLYEANEGIAV